MALTLDKLEAVYENLLALVRQEIDTLVSQDALEDKQVKSLETYDKILRAAIEMYENKAPKSTFDAKSTDDLLKDFD